jgi:alpha-amylase
MLRPFRKVIVALACASALLASPAQAKTKASETLGDEVVYHIFTRSMRDSNGDGQGDLRGIQQSLPYLQKLGVTTILLTPLYPSHVNHNYFAYDFEGIDPEYGTMDDYRALVKEIHRRKMRILLDMEFQYIVDDHAWWKAAQADRNSPYADYMLWEDRAKGIAEKGPFDLRVIEHFGKNTHGVTTVNLKAEPVKAYFDNYLHDWVDPNRDGKFDDGVDGFRLDHMMDDLDMRGLLTNLFTDFWKPRFDKLRAVNPRLTFVAEQWDWQYGEDFLTRGDTDAVFAFPIHDAIRKFDKAALVTAIERTAALTPAGKHQFVFAENHDVSRLASDKGMTPERLRTAATLMMFLKGTPIIYYGQELGTLGVIDSGYKTDESAIAVREAFQWDATEASKRHAIWYRNPAERYWNNRFGRDNDGIFGGRTGQRCQIATQSLPSDC